MEFQLLTVPCFSSGLPLSLSLLPNFSLFHSTTQFYLIFCFRNLFLFFLFNATIRKQIEEHKKNGQFMQHHSFHVAFFRGDEPLFIRLYCFFCCLFFALTERTFRFYRFKFKISPWLCWCCCCCWCYYSTILRIYLSDSFFVCQLPVFASSCTPLLGIFHIANRVQSIFNRIFLADRLAVFNLFGSNIFVFFLQMHTVHIFLNFVIEGDREIWVELIINFVWKTYTLFYVFRFTLRFNKLLRIHFHYFFPLFISKSPNWFYFTMNNIQYLLPLFLY